MSAITQDDERNITHFSSLYMAPSVPIEDLQQAGRLAVLSCTQDSHKYNALRNAIRAEAYNLLHFTANGPTFKPTPSSHKLSISTPRDARSGLPSIPCPPDTSLEHIDNLDELESLYTKAGLSPEERFLLDLSIGLSLPSQTVADRLSAYRGNPPSVSFTPRHIEKLISSLLTRLKSIAGPSDTVQ